eukprot:2112117-Rhodomonas_salina.2
MKREKLRLRVQEQLRQLHACGAPQPDPSIQAVPPMLRPALLLLPGTRGVPAPASHWDHRQGICLCSLALHTSSGCLLLLGLSEGPPFVFVCV